MLFSGVRRSSARLPREAPFSSSSTRLPLANTGTSISWPGFQSQVTPMWTMGSGFHSALT